MLLVVRALLRRNGRAGVRVSSHPDHPNLKLLGFRVIYPPYPPIKGGLQGQSFQLRQCSTLESGISRSVDLFIKLKARRSKLKGFGCKLAGARPNLKVQSYDLEGLGCRAKA